MSLQRFVLVMVLASSGLAACRGTTPAAAPTSTGLATTATAPTGYANITPAQLAGMLKSKDFFLVNVHTPYAGEIATTDAFLPYDQTAQQLGQYPASRQAKIVVYCRSGRLSAIAAAELVKAGYTNVWNLDGGADARRHSLRSIRQRLGTSGLCAAQEIGWPARCRAIPWSRRARR